MGVVNQLHAQRGVKFGVKGDCSSEKRGCPW